MKSKNRILILICFFFTVGLVIITPTIYGVVQQKNMSTIADNDTYVDKVNPAFNYGGVEYV